MLVERMVWDHKAGGSIPLTLTNQYRTEQGGGCTRWLRLAREHGFESHRPDQIKRV
jgi:hypothetical protein